MTEDITQQPLARAVLATLAKTRGGDDPLGSLARTVLGGEADLRTATTFSWHGRALGDALGESLARRDDLTPAERAEFERQAGQLRDAGEQLTIEADGTDADNSNTGESLR